MSNNKIFGKKPKDIEKGDISRRVIAVMLFLVVFLLLLARAIFLFEITFLVLVNPIDSLDARQCLLMLELGVV